MCFRGKKKGWGVLKVGETFLIACVLPHFAQNRVVCMSIDPVLTKWNASAASMPCKYSNCPWLQFLFFTLVMSSQFTSEGRDGMIKPCASLSKETELWADVLLFAETLFVYLLVFLYLSLMSLFSSFWKISQESGSGHSQCVCVCVSGATEKRCTGQVRCHKDKDISTCSCASKCNISGCNKQYFL